MRRLESIEDEMNGVVTFEFDNGQRLRVDGRLVREMGAAGAVHALVYAHLLPNGRLPLYQSGQQIGTLPVAFDPLSARSSSWLYDPRPGDFRRVGDRWIAAESLGPGDIKAVRGFAPLHPQPSEQDNG